MRRYLIILGLGCFVGLSGCADVQGRKGTEITMYPVMYQLNVDSNSSNSRDVERQMKSFIHQYWPVVSTQAVRLTAYNADGLELAYKLQGYLLHKGVAKDNIFLESGRENNDYDLEVAILRYVVETKKCDFHSVFNYYDAANGCHVDSNRWKSMVHPEKAVGGTPR